MGWEDESDNPESNQRRAALEMKQSNAEQRKKKAIASKSRVAKTKNKESSERLGSSKKPPSGKSSGSGKSSSSGSKAANGKAGGSNGDSARTNNTGRGGADPAATDVEGEIPSVENLLKVIERLRYKNETLDAAWKRADHENANVTMALKRVEHQLDGQQEKYDVDVGKLRKRVGTMQDRVSIVTRLEAGLLELCLEVRDRSADDLSSGGQHGGQHGESDPMRRHERSKNDLLKQCNNDVLVVLVSWVRGCLVAWLVGCFSTSLESTRYKACRRFMTHLVPLCLLDFVFFFFPLLLPSLLLLLSSLLPLSFFFFSARIIYVQI
jgi:hypothetical protein